MASSKELVVHVLMVSNISDNLQIKGFIAVSCLKSPQVMVSMDYLVSIREGLAMVIRNLEAELILHGNNDLHMIEAVQPQVLDEVGIRRQLLIVDLVKQVEDQHHPARNITIVQG